MNLVMNPEYTFKVSRYTYCMSDWEDKPLQHLDIIKWRFDEYVVLGWDSSEAKLVEEERYENFFFILIRNNLPRVAEHRDKLIEYANDRDKIQDYIKEMTETNKGYIFTHLSSNDLGDVEVLSSYKEVSALNFSDLIL